MTSSQNNRVERFKPIPKSFESISGKSNKEYLIKWGMLSKLKTFTFTYDSTFHMGSKTEFILDFFQDENVINSIQKLSTSGKWTNLGVKAKRVSVQDISCSLLSVDIFDRLNEKGIVREGGSIRKCLDQYFEDILISDELRNMLLIEDSDNYEIYSDAERDQFLFRLFKHLCIGGQVCQFEDNVQPYIDVTRSIYKDLISVQKDAQTKSLKVVSYVFKVEVFDESNTKIYPNNTVIEQDFCYLIIDPYKRHIIVLYHRFDGPLFLE